MKLRRLLVILFLTICIIPSPLILAIGGRKWYVSLFNKSYRIWNYSDEDLGI